MSNIKDCVCHGQGHHSCHFIRIWSQNISDTDAALMECGNQSLCTIRKWSCGIDVSPNSSGYCKTARFYGLKQIHVVMESAISSVWITQWFRRPRVTYAQHVHVQAQYVSLYMLLCVYLMSLDYWKVKLVAVSGTLHLLKAATVTMHWHVLSDRKILY